jgi:hypothetical protein
MEKHSNISRYVIRSHGSQKEIVQYFSGTEKKVLTTLNSISREQVLKA